MYLSPPEEPLESSGIPNIGWYLVSGRVFLDRLEDDIRGNLERALGWLDWRNLVPENSRIFIKPNLTWIEPTPGVTTRPEFIEAVVSVLSERSDRIIIGESDGGYHAFPAEDAFESHGLYALRDRYGVDVVNLSKGSCRDVTVEVGGTDVTVELPDLLLDGVDVFVTLPVPKVHVMTRVTLGLKNQWGCIPSTMRLRNHFQFSEKVVAINRILSPRLTLFDGKYFLDKSGPMKGEVVEMNLLIASDSVGAGSVVCCHVMQMRPQSVHHLRFATKAGIAPSSLEEVETNRPVAEFQTHRFTLQRSLINLIALAAFRSRLLTKLLYDSMFAGPIHKVLYAIRQNRLIGRLLYGRLGPPESKGHNQASGS